MMVNPVRLCLSLSKGFDLQATSQAANGLPARKVCRPGPFGNPFTMAGCREAGFQGDDAAIARRCVEAFKTWLGPHWRVNWDGPESEAARGKLLRLLPELRGHNLACFCRLDAPCHADALLDLANQPICEAEI